MRRKHHRHRRQQFQEHQRRAVRPRQVVASAGLVGRGQASVDVAGRVVDSAVLLVLLRQKVRPFRSMAIA